MKKNYPESPITELTDEQLDRLLEESEFPFSRRNQSAIESRVQEKRQTWLMRLQQLKRPQKWALGLAALLVFPTTVYGAAKIWQITTQHEGFLTTLSFEKQNSNQQSYRLDFTYVPENLTAIPQTKGTKYWHNETHDGGFSSLLLRPQDTDDYEVPYSQGVTESEINGKQTFLVDRSGNQSTFDTIAFMVFEEENLVVQVYLDQSLASAEQEKILAGITLTPVEKEEATRIFDLEEETTDPAPELTAVNKQLYDLEQSFEIKHPDTQLEIQATDYKTAESLPEYQANHLEDYGYAVDELQKNGLISESGELLSFTGTVIQAGDGRQTIDQEIKTLKIQPVYKEVTFTITNLAKEELANFYFSPMFEQEALAGGNDQEAAANQTIMPFVEFPEPAYIDQHGEGKAYYNIGSLAAGQTVKVRVGFIDIVPDENQEEFLSLDLGFNAEQTPWIKLPK